VPAGLTQIYGTLIDSNWRVRSSGFDGFGFAFAAKRFSGVVEASACPEASDAEHLIADASSFVVLKWKKQNPELESWSFSRFCSPRKTFSSTTSRASLSLAQPVGLFLYLISFQTDFTDHKKHDKLIINRTKTYGRTFSAGSVVMKVEHAVLWTLLSWNFSGIPRNFAAFSSHKRVFIVSKDSQPKTTQVWPPLALQRDKRAHSCAESFRISQTNPLGFQ
jgi:hypothetical protein